MIIIIIIISGSSAGSRKVSEYGGNLFGFGSRSVLGSGWPRDPIKESYYLDIYKFIKNLENKNNLHFFIVEYFNMSGFKVEGDTVTLVFEMRSGREHNTPDRAIWGFKVGSIIPLIEQFGDSR